MMNDTPATKSGEAILANLSHLFRARQFSAQQSYYLETELVAVFINPYPTDDPHLLHIPIEVRPLTGSKTSLQHVPICLDFATATDDPITGILHYGRLNQRGSVCFSHVAGGVYRLILPQQHRANQSDSVIDLLPQRTMLTPAAQSVPNASTAVPHFQRIFQSSNGALRVVVLLRETGEYVVMFQTPHQLWDGSVVRFLWHEHPTPATTTTPDALLVVLTWSPRHQRCVAEVNVGRVSDTFTLALPEEPEPLTMLETQSPDTIRRSIQIAHTYQARQAWQRLLAIPTLSPNIRYQIEQALQQ